MQDLERAFARAAAAYNANRPHLDQTREVIRTALELLGEAELGPYADFRLRNVQTRYSVFTLGASVSRPVVTGMLIGEEQPFEELEAEALRLLRAGQPYGDEEAARVTTYLYTAVMAFACCYDLWKPGSRKTPGTFFEIFMAALFGLYAPRHRLSKHVNLGDLLGVDVDANAPDDAVDEEAEDASVSTDIVVTSSVSGISAVLPLKITTRERIVQPYAHQRILDAARPGLYRSFLCCMSETQLDKKKRRVNQICVPGTVRLFQRFLSRLDGLYYCDIPARYAWPEFTRQVPVKPLGFVFADVAALLDREA
ncbi:type II site-specific deoxyribonuclease [Methylorubrum zatmanii]|uniref:Uncharacterized protein n=1 Tax=Methylorubrum zatmanii TaxID=29429 RepID=A0ABW1WJD1_9HYPH|nr:type II site-specific deoxyribonuclease [Methylorubrum zatmanii]MBD8906920.1 type II site-specific deoxyribonuclease [Methylorubrum zatmanii]